MHQALFSIPLFMLLLFGCATTERVTVLQTPIIEVATIPYTGKKVPVSIGKFNNKSNAYRGIFNDGVDRLGNQAKTILAAYLNQSNRFIVLDRENAAEAQREAEIKNQNLQLRGADYLITGNITEFGRKEVGDRQLFGILGRGKEQIAYAKVTVNVIRALTSEVVYSTQGAGEYVLSNREVVGFGSTASYDSSLNGKVLDLAIKEVVEKLAKSVDRGAIYD